MAGVLVVEDEEEICLLAEEILQEAGHRTLAAANVGEALSHLRSERPIDVILADVVLGSSPFAGLELAHAAVSLRPKLRVLYVSGTALTDDMKAMFVPGSALLSKPYAACDLARAVDNLTRG